jgi:hypothetical protein
MDKICPLCNGLYTITYECPNCGRLLEDGGLLQNYLGPYSPYMESDIVGQCTHLLYCADCHYDVRVAIETVMI